MNKCGRPDLYRDLASGLTLDIDGLNPGTFESHHIVFGDEYSNLIEGGALDDRLYGGAGDDYPEMQAALDHEGCTIVLCHSVN